MLLASYLRNLCLTQSHKDFLLFSLRKFIVLGFTFKSIIHFELNTVSNMRYGLRFFIFIWISNCSSTNVEKFILSSLKCICGFVKIQLTIYVLVYFWTLFGSIDLYYLFTSTTLF